MVDGVKPGTASTATFAIKPRRSMSIFSRKIAGRGENLRSGIKAVSQQVETLAQNLDASC
jgi:hypothetical protein